MSINAYVGLMGSGKSYEVVSSVIVNALKAGRDVVTNINGIKYEAIVEYLLETTTLEPKEIGKIVHIELKDGIPNNFYPDYENKENIVKYGDLLCIDEAWRYWGKGIVVPKADMLFFREHRHFTNEKTGVSCDLAVIVQSIQDLNLSLRNVIEMTFRTHKLKTIGRNTNYKLEIYEGSNLRKKPLNTIIKKYDKRIFELYSSYVGTKGKELQIDDRQNIFKTKKFLIPLFLGIVLLLTLIPLSYKIFNPAPQKEKRIEINKKKYEEFKQKRVSLPSALNDEMIGDVIEDYQKRNTYILGYEKNCKKKDDCDYKIFIKTPKGKVVLKQKNINDNEFFTKIDYENNSIIFN